MFTVRVLIHILYKNHKQESQKTYNCIPSRLELTNRTPVKNKEQAEIYQNQSQNLDEAVYLPIDEMSRRPLEYQRNQPERLQREDEAKDDSIEYKKEHAMIKSWFCWKTHRKKFKCYVMIQS